MRQKSTTPETPSERLVTEPPASNIRPRIRIVLDGLRGEVTIAELCRREGIAESLYYSWSKEFLEAGKRRLAGDTARSATTSEVKDLKRQTGAERVVAEQTLELRLLKKSMTGDGGDEA
jgi:transposase